MRIVRVARREFLYLALVLIAPSLLVLGSQKGDSTRGIRAEKITIEDQAGKVRLILGVNKDGTAGISCYDGLGRNRLTMGLRPDGAPMVTLSDKLGKPRLEMYQSDNGSVSAVCLGSGGEERLRFGVAPNGTSAMIVSGRKGQGNVTVRCSPEGESLIDLYAAGDRDDWKWRLDLTALLGSRFSMLTGTSELRRGSMKVALPRTCCLARAAPRNSFNGSVRMARQGRFTTARTVTKEPHSPFPPRTSSRNFA